MHRLYQEVWKSGKLYTYSVDDFSLVQSAMGPLADGWGATTDNASLILSDGSNVLSWVDPATLAVQRTVTARSSCSRCHAHQAGLEGFCVRALAAELLTLGTVQQLAALLVACCSVCDSVGQLFSWPREWGVTLHSACAGVLALLTV